FYKRQTGYRKQPAINEQPPNLTSALLSLWFHWQLMEPTNPSPEEKKENQAKPYLKYSGLAFQMVAIMLAAVWGGRWLDAYFQTNTPWWTLGLLLVAVFASMYSVIVSLTKK